MSDTLITAEVDLDAPGKQSGYLRVPHSVDRSAYGWIGVPITVVAGGPGPTLVISAGVHGDEYEGQIAVAELARSLDAETMSGRVVLLPMLNLPACAAGRRVSPLDDGNMNRLFPGDARGTPSEMIAHWHETVLLPLADYAVDLHSGGSSLFYPATLLRGPGVTAEETAMLKQMQAAMDLPYAWVFTGGGGRQSTARTAMGAANRQGVVNIMAELGGQGCVTPEILARTRRGLQRLLVTLGICEGEIASHDGTRELYAQGSVYAYESGLFEPLKTIGDAVSRGETVALLHHPETPNKAPDEVASPFDGVVMCLRGLAQVRRGDALYQIGRDAG